MAVLIATRPATIVSHKVGAVRDQPEVERHADGGEEQAQQQAFERGNVGHDLVAVVGICEQHAGDEGSEGRGQVGQLHHQGHADHGQQSTRRHGFLHPRAGDQAEHAVEQIATHDHHGQDDADGFGGRYRFHGLRSGTHCHGE